MWFVLRTESMVQAGRLTKKVKRDHRLDGGNMNTEDPSGEVRLNDRLGAAGVRVNHGNVFGTRNWYTFHCPCCNRQLTRSADPVACGGCDELLDWRT